VLSGEHTAGRSHELVASALTGLVQAGWSDADACRAVEQSPGLSWRVGESERRGWGWLMRRAAEQRAWVAEHPVSDYSPAVRVELAAARQALRAWAPTDELRAQLTLPRVANLRAVGDALLGLADKLGRVQHLSVGVRELAELSGVAVGTVRKALPVWRAVGLVVQVEPSRWVDGVQLAATYRLELSALDSDTPHEVLVSAVASSTVGHDAWRHGALGHGGWDAWALLHPVQAADPDELAQLLGVSRRTVLRRLERLELHRLVTRTPYGWTRCPEQLVAELLELAAVHEQSVGTGERQRERHAAERTERREARERWVAHLRAEHRRQLLEHAVREPDELVPVARERAPAERELAELLTADLTRAGQLVRSAALEAVAEQVAGSFRGVQDALAGPLAQLAAVARTVQVFGEGVARWSEQHERELQAARAQGVDGG
jgi:DNA-binding transcriptional ArsR family regulator